MKKPILASIAIALQSMWIFLSMDVIALSSGASIFVFDLLRGDVVLIEVRPAKLSVGCCTARRAHQGVQTDAVRKAHSANSPIHKQTRRPSTVSPISHPAVFISHKTLAGRACPRRS